MARESAECGMSLVASSSGGRTFHRHESFVASQWGSAVMDPENEVEVSSLSEGPFGMKVSPSGVAAKSGAGLRPPCPDL